MPDRGPLTPDNVASEAEAAAATPAAAGDDRNQDHDSLKYHLLGPSLTKAGQDSVDQGKVSEIIYNASKGSKYFNNEEFKDKTLTHKIERILVRKKELEKADLASDLRRADDYIAELEASRDLSQTIVHIDCDAFYAAVEELDRPELKNVPMAVGKGVLTTCNYHARKFGCRSGMAGFVAMKLCPTLICLPLNFAKYTAKAQEVREILADYDERFESASIDEAYLNITKYCQEKSMSPEDAISQLRAEVAGKTKITISAGIAPNAKIAKIASNKNKPNGQFTVANDRSTIMAFMEELPTRKVNGVGRVFERELDAIGIRTCGDIYAQRAYLAKLFGQKAFQFLMQCYLGLGRTKIKPAEEYIRKSVGTESTFSDLSGRYPLRDKLQRTVEELEKDLARTKFKGKTLVLKIKLYTYEVFTRQVILPKAVSTAEELYRYAVPMLTKLEREIPNMKLRLMGLRCTNLVSTKKVGVDFFGAQQLNAHKPASHRSISDDPARNEDSEWETWPEAEFEQAARDERQEEMNELERLSQEQPAAERADEEVEEDDDDDPRRLHGKLVTPNPSRATAEAAPTASWKCPIWRRPQPPDDREFNRHIDHCLSRQTIKEAVQDASALPAAEQADESVATIAPGAAKPGKRKNGRVSGSGDGGGGARPAPATKKQRSIFG